MTRQTRAEIENSLLMGRSVLWTEGMKREMLQLSTPVQRRLYKFVLSSKVREVKGLPATFISGLTEAFNGTDDPAAAIGLVNTAVVVPGPWRLTRIETLGFGGVNVHGGPSFVHEVGGDSLVIDGPNGSGKSSLVGSLTWAFRGERNRDATPDGGANAVSQVYDDNGKKLGDWPPIACYPPKAGLLLDDPVVSVKLTFANPAGQEASLERNLKGGLVTATEDPALAFPAVLVETGLMMPARLGQIRWGSGDRQLTESVQMMTGLDEVAVLGDFVGELCHKGRDFLGYSKAQRRDEVLRQFEDSMDRTEKALATLGRTCAKFSPSDTRDPNGPMALLGQELMQNAASAVSVIGSDLLPTLDLKIAAVQQQIAAAIEGAKGEVAEGLGGLAAWKAVSTIATALVTDATSKLVSAIGLASSRLTEATQLHEKSSADSRFQLKALAAAWHQQHSTGDVESCPLCEQDLSTRPHLASEIAALRTAGESATRAYKDNLNAIRVALLEGIPVAISRIGDEVLTLRPKKDCEEQLRNRFVEAARYSSCLIGVAQVMKDALADVPTNEILDAPPSQASQFPAGADALLKTLAICERFLAVSEWAKSNQAPWIAWWTALTIRTTGTPTDAKLAAKLQQLEEAIKAWTPYRDASAALRDAWKHGLSVDKIDVEQGRRQKIADNLKDLKGLRKLAEAETKAAIEGLSFRMAKFLGEIYVSEKLQFRSAHLEKKAGVAVRGGFDPGMRIDASLVANSSWIRALLWAFVFSLREEAVEQLGEDRLPLLVLDDPQATFDITHRHRWIQRIVALQKKSPGLQVLLATHDEPFLDQLNNLGVDGRRTHLSAAAPDTGHLHLADGSAIARAWDAANAQKTPAAAITYLEKTRKHIEAILKVMLRGEIDTRTMTIGELIQRIKELNAAKNTPWNRTAFRELANRVKGTVELKHLEESHHTTGNVLGFAEATDVEAWRKSLEPLMDRAFRQMREYRLLHGESKALHADPAIIPLPEGHRDALRTLPLKLIGRAAALTGGRVADGALSVSDYGVGQHETVVLGDHEAYRIAVPTLEPVARPGDVLLVARHGNVPVGSLVVATCSEHLLARRFQVAVEHPDVAVLTAQAITPSSIAPPLIAHLSTVVLRKIVGVLFDPGAFPIAVPPGCEVVDCGGDAAVKKFVKGTIGLVEVSGQSAEPQALNGQYLLVGDDIAPAAACGTLDGMPVLAADSNGHHYFKRLRTVNQEMAVLESLHSGGEYPPVLLYMPGKGDPHLAKVLPVIGVLFERS